MRTALAVALLAAAGLAATLPAHAARKKLLVVSVTKGFRHDSIPVAEQTIAELGRKYGWDVDYVRTDEEMQEKMVKPSLEQYDGVCFANTTGVLPLPDPQGFLDYISEGHGFMATHSGADTFHQWPGQTSGISKYVELLGAEFLTHHSQCAVDGHIMDPDFPAMAPVVHAGESGKYAGADPRTQSIPTRTTWTTFDEMYLFKNVQRDKLHVLLESDHHFDDGSPEAGQPGEYLISWCKAYGKGRVFYTSLGHRQEMWHDPVYQAHLAGGIRWALRLARGSDKPNPPGPSGSW